MRVAHHDCLHSYDPLGLGPPKEQIIAVADNRSLTFVSCSGWHGSGAARVLTNGSASAVASQPSQALG
jgi:hypothetical protein